MPAHAEAHDSRRGRRSKASTKTDLTHKSYYLEDGCFRTWLRAAWGMMASDSLGPRRRGSSLGKLFETATQVLSRPRA